MKALRDRIATLPPDLRHGILPPWKLTRSDAEGVENALRFARFLAEDRERQRQRAEKL